MKMMASPKHFKAPLKGIKSMFKTLRGPKGLSMKRKKAAWER